MRGPAALARLRLHVDDRLQLIEGEITGHRVIGTALPAPGRLGSRGGVATARRKVTVVPRDPAGHYTLAMELLGVGT